LPDVSRAQFVAMLCAFHVKIWEGWRAADPKFKDGKMPSLPVNRARMVAGNAADFKEYFETVANGAF